MVMNFLVLEREILDHMSNQPLTLHDTIRYSAV